MADDEVKITVDNVGSMLAEIEALTNAEVLVGVPATKAGRKKKKDEPEGVNNAYLAFIHEHGSPWSQASERGPRGSDGLRSREPWRRCVGMLTGPTRR